MTLTYKHCEHYQSGNCELEKMRWGFPYKCINEDYKDGKNYCVEYEPDKEPKSKAKENEV